MKRYYDGSIVNAVSYINQQQEQQQSNHESNSTDDDDTHNSNHSNWHWSKGSSKSQFQLFKSINQIFNTNNNGNTNHDNNDKTTTTNILYNYRHPDLIRGGTGQRMQLDIYLPDYSLAFEYQGKQHYEDVEVFGKANIRNQRVFQIII